MLRTADGLISETEMKLAKNTGIGRRNGAVANRMQKYNPLTGRWDKFTRDGHYIKTKSDSRPWKGIPKL